MKILTVLLPPRTGRMFRSGASIALALALGVAGATAASTVYLKSGAEVKGEIVSTKPGHVVIDLGFTVLTVPRDEIDRVVDADAPAAASREDTPDLYQVAPEQPALNVKENVERCGGAVVQVRTPVGLGSGFLIDPQGYVVTNEHVVAGENRIVVVLYRRGKTEQQTVQYSKVRIVALDSRLDLALLKIEDAAAAVFPTVALGDSGALNEGQTVFAIGSPLGLERTVSQGIVSRKTRALDGQLFIQTTAQINPGNSGGPLFNLRGEVIGVNDMKAMGVGVEGLGFTIPSATLKSFLRNRDAYAFDPRNPNAGYRYLEPPGVPHPKN
jgi:serine protease Do